MPAPICLKDRKCVLDRVIDRGIRREENYDSTDACGKLLHPDLVCVVNLAVIQYEHKPCLKVRKNHELEGFEKRFRSISAFFAAKVDESRYPIKSEN